jgi:hypothetical protein
MRQSATIYDALCGRLEALPRLLEMLDIERWLNAFATPPFSES